MIVVVTATASCKDKSDDIAFFSTESSLVSDDSVAFSSSSQTQETSIREDIYSLADGRYLARLYTDSKYYSSDDDNGIDVTFGLVDGSSTVFYDNDSILVHNIGDNLIIDDDLKIKIESMDIQGNTFISNRFYEPGEEFIRISHYYVLVHPDGSNFGVDNSLDDYWVLGRLDDSGNYQYVGEYMGKMQAHINSDCIVKIWDYSNEMWNYDDSGFNDDGLPIPHIIPVSSFVSFMSNLSNVYDRPVCIEAIIEIKDGEIVYIESMPGDVIVEAE